MPKPVAVPGWAIVRFQSRSALWTSWPAGAVERVRRRQFVIKSQVHGQELNSINIYTNNSDIKYPVFGVFTLAVQWEST